MALSESSNIGGVPQTHSREAAASLAFNKTSILGLFQVVSDPPILGKKSGRRRGETRQTSPSCAIACKAVLGLGSGKTVCITEAQLRDVRCAC